MKSSFTVKWSSADRGTQYSGSGNDAEETDDRKAPHMDFPN